MSQPETRISTPLAALPSGTRRVFVRDLVLDASIGIYRHEREARQRVIVNLDLAVSEGGTLDDSPENIVCYERMARGAREIVEGGHINLVETLAEQLASMCLADPRVLFVRVRVEKPDAIAEASSVGVEIERFNEDALGPEIERINRFRQAP